MRFFLREIGQGPRAGRDLTRDEAREAMSLILSQQATPAQAGGLLLVQRYKGESPDELIGFAEAVRATARTIAPNVEGLLDIGSPYDGRKRRPRGARHRHRPRAAGGGAVARRDRRRLHAPGAVRAAGLRSARAADGDRAAHVPQHRGEDLQPCGRLLQPSRPQPPALRRKDARCGDRDRLQARDDRAGYRRQRGCSHIASLPRVSLGIGTETRTADQPRRLRSPAGVRQKPYSPASPAATATSSSSTLACVSGSRSERPRSPKASRRRERRSIRAQRGPS